MPDIQRDQLAGPWDAVVIPFVHGMSVVMESQFELEHLGAEAALLDLLHTSQALDARCLIEYKVWSASPGCAYLANSTVVSQMLTFGNSDVKS